MKMFMLLLAIVYVSLSTSVKGQPWSPVTIKGAQTTRTGTLNMTNSMFMEVLMNLKSSPIDGGLLARTLKEKQFTAKESQDFLKAVVQAGSQGLGSLFHVILNEMWAKCLTAMGGIKNLDLDAPFFQNNTLIYHMPEAYYKSLSESQFDKILSLAWNGTKSDALRMDFVPEKTMQTEGYRHICKRLFWGSPKGLNITEDLLKKRLLFIGCAPVDFCQNIPVNEIVNEADFFEEHPITCSETMNDLQKNMVRLYPGARPCFRAMIGKVVNEMFDGIQRFRNILSCTDGNTMIKHMTNKSCEELLYIMDVFPKTVDSYIVERCVQLPSDYSTVDCPTVQQNFSRYLKYLPRDFPLQLPQETLCDPTCREVFQNGLDDGMKKTLVNKCFTKTNAPLTRETLAGMKSMITNLPLKSLKEISKEDLEANFDVIKQGIQSGESTKTTGKNMAVREIVKKLTQESGNLSMISDCNSCIQSLSVRDLKKTLKSNDTAGMLTSLGLDKHNVQFTDSQDERRRYAAYLGHWLEETFLLEETAQANLGQQFREMKSIVKGLVSQDMQKIAQENKNNSDGLEIATVFCEQTTWPSKTLHSIHGMIVDGLKYRNSSHPMKALTGVDVAGFGCECLINFSEDQLSSMDPLVCTDVCQKVGKCDNFVRINAAHRNNFFSGCMKCQNLKMENFTADTIEALGSNLLAQLTPAQVALMPSSAFQAMYDKLSGMCLSPEQGQAVTNKLATVAAPELTTDDMYKLSSAMYHLPAAAQASLNKTVLKNMAKSLLTKLVPTDLDGMRARKECEQWLDDAGRAQLKEARFKFLLTLKNALMSSTARRKRSATSFWTCSNIQAFPDLFVMANVTEIEGITGNDFKDCILEIGSLNWNTEQKAALKAKMLSAYNVSSACNIEDISSIGTLAQTLTVTEINCLNLNNSILVTALGKQAGWSTNQSSALASNVLADRGLTNLSQNDTAFLASLGAIMCGFEPQVIKTMPPTIYLESDPQFSLYSDCTTSHLVALKEVVNDPLVYGAPGTWTAATTSELIYVIGGLTGPEIKNLSRDAIEGITTASIPFIPGNVLKELSMEQLSMLSDRQAVAVTAIQKLALSSEQVNKLTELATGASTVQPANATTAKPANATTVQPTNATTAKPANATTVQPANATTAKPANATTVQPANATTVQPANATTVQPANATTVQPANATTVQPANATTAKPAADTTTKPAETTTAKTGGASVGTQVAVSLFTTLLMLMASALILL